MIHGLLNGHVPAGDAQVFKDGFQDGLLVLLVQHQEGLGVLHHMAVLLQKPHAEAVEGGDPPQILIRQTPANPFAHFSGGLIGKGDTENVGSGNAQLLHKEQVPRRQRPGLAGACAGHHTDTALGGGHRFTLFGIQFFQIIRHGRFPPAICFSGLAIPPG